MEIEKFFAIKLKTEIDSRPRGYQAELAGALGLRRGVLNNYLSCKRGTDEGLRRKICQIVGLDYEEIVREWQEFNSYGENAYPVQQYIEEGKTIVSMDEDTAHMVSAILSSRSQLFRAALITSVKALHKAVQGEVKMEHMEVEISDLKRSMAKMEANMEGQNNTIVEMLLSLGAKIPQKRENGGLPA